MTNTNCLRGIQCPNCENEDRFRIAGTTIFTVTDDGTDDYGDIEWDDASFAGCPECGRHGTLRDFRTVPLPAANVEVELAKRPYSVLLLYPEYANDGGAETYYAFVEAPDPRAAVALARRQALAAQVGVIFPPEDFIPLLVTEGHHYGQPMSND